MLEVCVLHWGTELSRGRCCNQSPQHGLRKRPQDQSLTVQIPPWNTIGSHSRSLFPLSATSLPCAGHIEARPGCLLITLRGSICSHPRARRVKSWLAVLLLPAHYLRCCSRQPSFTVTLSWLSLCKVIFARTCASMSVCVVVCLCAQILFLCRCWNFVTFENSYLKIFDNISDQQIKSFLSSNIFIKRWIGLSSGKSLKHFFLVSNASTLCNLTYSTSQLVVKKSCRQVQPVSCPRLSLSKPLFPLPSSVRMLSVIWN